MHEQRWLPGGAWEAALHLIPVFGGVVCAAHRAVLESSEVLSLGLEQVGSRDGLAEEGVGRQASPLGETTRPRPLRAPLYTTSTMSMNSCLSFMAQFT